MRRSSGRDIMDATLTEGKQNWGEEAEQDLDGRSPPVTMAKLNHFLVAHHRKEYGPCPTFPPYLVSPVCGSGAEMWNIRSGTPGSCIQCRGPIQKNEVTQGYLLILDILIGIRGLKVKVLSGTLVLRLHKRARLSKR